MRKIIIFFFTCFLFTKVNCDQIKEWTFIVYMAADNNLNSFAIQNLNDMKIVGSTNKLSILVQYDGQGIKETTKRLFVDKDKIYYTDNQPNTKLDTGCEDTLFDCFKWATETCPANHYAIILWNHGIGILDPLYLKSVNPSDLFVLNSETNLLEIDRSKSFADFIEKTEKTDTSNDYQRGICFSDTYHSYLTNKKLNKALSRIKNELLNGKNIDLIGFDACLMSMTEVACLVKPYCNYMVASQEVELGPGWPYSKILQKVSFQSLSPALFAKNIVTEYGDFYKSISSDFTQSAISLNNFNQFEESINNMLNVFSIALLQESNATFTKSVKASKSNNTCIHFFEPSYIDFSNFLTNLLSTIVFMTFKQSSVGIKSSLKTAILNCLSKLNTTVIANSTGRSLKKAMGLSIYFPNYTIDQSYLQTTLDQTSLSLQENWIKFIKKFI